MTRSTLVKKESRTLEVSPLKSLVDELDFVRKTFLDSLSSFRERVEGEIVLLRELANVEAARSKPNMERIREARDMITLLRTMPVKPEKGRRRDLKKIEATIKDVRQMMEEWE